MKYYIHVLKNYASFDGRARRKEYWMFTLFSIIITIILSTIDVMNDWMLTDDDGITSTVYSLFVLVPTLAVGVRRMHDLGKSGWYILIPIYNIILFATNGNVGPNEYGPDPKAENGLDIEDHIIED